MNEILRLRLRITPRDVFFYSLNIITIMPLLRSVKDTMFRTYCRTRNKRPIWYHVLNRESKNLWRAHKPVIPDMRASEIISSLKRDGIAVTSLQDFFPNIRFEDLARFASEAIARPDIQEEMRRHKLMIAERVETGGKRAGAKKYLKDFIVEPYGSTTKEIIPDMDNPYIRMNLDERVLAIAGSYMGLAPKFRGFSLRVTLPVPPGAPEYFSQRWHRDPEDRNMLKMFLYMTDVLDEASGPFTYIKGSQPGGPMEHVFRQRPPAATYPELGAVEKAIPKEFMHMALGKTGTIIFADTSGLHKGGYTTSRERIMYTGTFYSNASPAKHRLIPQQDISGLPPLVRYALD